MGDIFGTITSLSIDFRNGNLKPSDVVRAHLQMIESLDNKLGAFETVFSDDAMRQAHLADIEISAGSYIGPLHGIPFAIKDIFDLEGTICTKGSLALKKNRSECTGTVVQRLISAGGIIIGKTKTVEHAFGGWGTNQKMGTPWNPWDTKNHRIPGGSSSGSAVATAAKMAVFAIGSDTGGSIRLPAAFCGITGLKLTEGTIPCDGIMPLSQTLDTPGPITQNIVDSTILLEIIKGRNSSKISDDLLKNRGIYAGLRKKIKGMRFGIITPEEREHCSNEVLKSYDNVIEKILYLGAHVDTFKPPVDYSTLADDNGAITAIEAYSNHRKLYERVELPLDEDVRQRIFEGRKYSAFEYLDMLNIRESRKEKFLCEMNTFDALLTPTFKSVAPKVDEVDQSISPGHFTRPFNYLGFCGVSIPVSLSKNCLPIGFQIIGRATDEETVLRIGYAIESIIPSIGRPSL